MNLEKLRAWCAAKPGSREDFPFDDETLVWKVGTKMYGLANVNTAPTRMNLKCDPALARDLRSSFPEVILPGYHMNKEHWNTVVLDGTLPDEKVQWLIDLSYNLVFRSLPKAEREKILNR